MPPNVRVIFVSFTICNFLQDRVSMPQVLNPEIKFSPIRSSNESKVLFNGHGNISLEIVPLWDFFYSKIVLCQAPFRGRKNATSNGWHKWVLFGGSNMNLISRSLRTSIIFMDMWLARLSPITAFGPLQYLKYGITIFTNQSSIVKPSNQPLLVLL